MHTLSNYNNSGVLIVTPEGDLPSSQQALNANFKTLATVVTGYVPYTGATGTVDLNGQMLQNVGSLAVTGASSLDNRSIITDGIGDVTIDNSHTGSGPALTIISNSVITSSPACQITNTDNSQTVSICDGGQALVVVGPTTLDNGAITTDGSGDLTLGARGQ